MAKSVIPEITSHASTYAFDSHKSGRRALLYLLVPRASRHFTPATIVSLAETDEARARTSKKDNDVRVRELRAAASSDLLKLVEEKGEDMLRDPGASLLCAEIMLFAEGDSTAAIDALLEPLGRTYPTPTPSSGELMHVIDIPHSSRVYKTLLQGGHYDRLTSTISRPAPAPAAPTTFSTGTTAPPPPQMFSASKFASRFLETVGQEGLVRMAEGGNGAFVVAELVRRVEEEGSAEEKNTVKGWFGKGVVGKIEKSGGRGVGELVARLKAL